MSHRVIAGSAKGRKLKLVPGNSTRPIMDRVKEALFSIIGRDIIDSHMLDMFAGTGAVGIEALSRGAEHVTFTDLDRMAVKTIHENLKITNFAQNATVKRVDALNMIKGTPTKQFDFIYVAPPQYKGLWLTALQYLDSNIHWLKSDGTIIIQIDPSERQDIVLTYLHDYKTRFYGKTLLEFYSIHDNGEKANK